MSTPQLKLKFDAVYYHVSDMEFPLLFIAMSWDSAWCLATTWPALISMVCFSNWFLIRRVVLCPVMGMHV
jgi:hypothetical protein